MTASRQDAPVDQTAPRFRYRAYGLEISSAIELPELQQSDSNASPDLTIALRRMGRPVPGRGEPGLFVSEGEEHYFAWHEVGGFSIKAGAHIDIDPRMGAPASLLNFPLLGPVMALVLHGRGNLVLHGSALHRDRDCIVLLGDKGAGKSTTAAMLLSRGFRLLADDVVALSFASGAPQVMRAFPQIKLSDAATRALPLAGSVARERPMPAFPKVPVRLADDFGSEAEMPTRIYILNRADEASVEIQAPDAALRLLMRYSFMPLLEKRGWKRSPADSARHFMQCAALSRTCQVATLFAPRGLDRGGELYEAVDTDLRANLETPA